MSPACGQGESSVLMVQEVRNNPRENDSGNGSWFTRMSHLTGKIFSPLPHLMALRAVFITEATEISCKNNIQMKVLNLPWDASHCELFWEDHKCHKA